MNLCAFGSGSGLDVEVTLRSWVCPVWRAAPDLQMTVRLVQSHLCPERWVCVHWDFRRALETETTETLREPDRETGRRPWSLQPSPPRSHPPSCRQEFNRHVLRGDWVINENVFNIVLLNQGPKDHGTCFFFKVLHLMIITLICPNNIDKILSVFYSLGSEAHAQTGQISVRKGKEDHEGDEPAVVWEVDGQIVARLDVTEHEERDENHTSH